MCIFNRVLCSLIKRANPKEILDVGCGEGQTTACVKQNFPDVKISGIEVSENSLEKAKSVHKHINFEEGSIYSIKRENNSYDLVLCTEVLEHLDDPLKGLL